MVPARHVRGTTGARPVPLPGHAETRRGQGGSTSSEPLLTPTCSDLEYDRCTAERVVLDRVALQTAGTPGELWTTDDVSAWCILRETGSIEACKLDRAPEPVARSVATILERRRYRPARYRGTPVPVAYGFTVALSQTPSAARTAFRAAAFEFLVDEAIRQEADGGVRMLCISAGEDRSPAEVAAIHRPGWSILPASLCSGTRQNPNIYIDLVAFQVLGNRGKGRAQIGFPYVGGNDLTLTIERGDAGWSFHVDKRSEYVH